MRNALVIAGREIAAYFVQPIAYVVMTVFLLLGRMVLLRPVAPL